MPCDEITWSRRNSRYKNISKTSRVYETCYESGCSYVNFVLEHIDLLFFFCLSFCWTRLQSVKKIFLWSATILQNATGYWRKTLPNACWYTLHSTGNENGLIFLLVLDFLIDLNYLKASAIKKCYLSCIFQDACMTDKIILDLNLAGFGDFYLLVSSASDLWLGWLQSCMIWRAGEGWKTESTQGRRRNGLLQQLSFRVVFENTSFFRQKFGFHREHLNAGIILWNHLSTLYVEKKKAFFNSYKVLLFILYKLVCFLNCPLQEKN